MLNCFIRTFNLFKEMNGVTKKVDLAVSETAVIDNTLW